MSLIPGNIGSAAIAPDGITGTGGAALNLPAGYSGVGQTFTINTSDANITINGSGNTRVMVSGITAARDLTIDPTGGIAAGEEFIIRNTTTYPLTVKANNGDVITTVTYGEAVVIAYVANPSTGAGWKDGKYVNASVVKAVDGNGIKFQENGGAEVGSISDTGTTILGAASGTTDGHTARANSSIPFKIKNNDATGSFAQFINSGGALGYVGHDTTGFKVYASNGSTAWGSTDTSGNWTMLGNVTSSGGNFIVSTSGKGIDFSATASIGTASSELLNDYEEGTYTPSFTGTFSLGDGTVTGYYTKIGRQVTVWVAIVWGSTTTTTGLSLQTFSLPVNPAANSSSSGIWYCRDSGSGAIKHGYLLLRALVGGTIVEFRTLADAHITASDPIPWSSGDEICLSFTYFV